MAQRLVHGRVVSIVERQAAYPFDRPQLHFTLTETGSGQTARKSFTFDFFWDPQWPGVLGNQWQVTSADGTHIDYRWVKIANGASPVITKQDDGPRPPGRTLPSREAQDLPGPICAQAGSSALHLQEDGALEARVAMD